jgi:predicted XRE-type DNA-binding protein
VLCIYTVFGQLGASRLLRWGEHLSIATAARTQLVKMQPKRKSRRCGMAAKRIVEGVEVEPSSGNVFADLGLPDTDKLKIKSGLVIEITKAMRRLGLTQQQAAARMGITQPKVSDMQRGDFSNLSERKLMDCLNRLGYDIEISVKPAKASVGQLTLAMA